MLGAVITGIRCTQRVAECRCWYPETVIATIVDLPVSGRWHMAIHAETAFAALRVEGVCCDVISFRSVTLRAQRVALGQFVATVRVMTV